MKLSSWSTNNYRSIESINIDIGSFTALIGKNNSGKSNIAESIVFYAKKIRNNIHIENVRNSEIVRDQDSSKNVEFEAIFSLSVEEQEIAAREITDQGLVDKDVDQMLTSGDVSSFRHRGVFSESGSITEEFYVRFENRWLPYQYRPNDHQKGVYSIKNPGRYLDNSGLFPYRIRDSDKIHQYNATGFGKVIPEPFQSWVMDFVTDAEKIGAIRRPEGDLKIREDTELNSDVRNLPNVLHTLSQNNKKKYKTIAENYIQVMEGVTDVTTPISTRSGTTKTTIEIIERNNSYTLDEISSGSMEILALITKLVLSENNVSILVIEEPELHLHPDAEREILELMNNITDDSPQILITTHSDVFVDSTDIEKIIRVVRDDYTECRKIGSVGKELADLGYKKSGFLQSNGVVFVEGKSDERVIKQLCHISEFDMDEEGIEWVELDGEGNIKSDGRSLIKLLYSFDIPYLFIADSHDEDPNEVLDDYLSHINSRKGEWHTTPDHFFILSGYGIEEYLIQMPDAIASVVNASVEEVHTTIEKIDGEDSYNLLNELFIEHLGVEYNKAEHGMLIAKHATQSEIPEELTELIDELKHLVEE